MVQIQVLFRNNINYLYQETLGVEANGEENENLFRKCVNNIAYHENGVDKNNVKENLGGNANLGAGKGNLGAGKGNLGGITNAREKVERN